MVVFIVLFFVLSIVGALVQVKLMSPQYYSFNNFHHNNNYQQTSKFQRLLRIISCKKRVDEVPLLDVVSLEDY